MATTTKKELTTKTIAKTKQEISFFNVSMQTQKDGKFIIHGKEKNGYEKMKRKSEKLSRILNID